MTERGLRHVELVSQVAETGFTRGCLTHECHQLDTDRIGKRLEERGDRRDVIRIESGLFRRRHGQRDHLIPLSASARHVLPQDTAEHRFDEPIGPPHMGTLARAMRAANAPAAASMPNTAGYPPNQLANAEPAHGATAAERLSGADSTPLNCP
jgi:hypothetical protein